MSDFDDLKKKFASQMKNFTDAKFTDAKVSGTGDGDIPKYTNTSPKKRLPLIITLVVLVVAIIVLSQSLVVTKENEYSLIKEFGKVEMHDSPVAFIHECFRLIL